MPHPSNRPPEKHWSPYLGSEWGMEKEPLVPPARGEAHRAHEESNGSAPAAQRASRGRARG